MKKVSIKIFLLVLLFLNITVSQGLSISIEQKSKEQKELKHVLLSYLITEIATGKTVCSYQSDLLVSPASVLKIVTTATALELLGEDYQYPTTLLYDGEIQDSILQGNIYIKGYGDPTLGSSYLSPKSGKFLQQWIEAVQELGIREINGAIISDESLFDTEGISMKWVREDLGSYYGAGSYALNVFDNRFNIYIKSDAPNTRPQVVETFPKMEITFHNYLRSKQQKKDSSYVVGMPFSSERFLYGTVPAYQNHYKLRGDIPDPPLFLAQYLQQCLEETGIRVNHPAMCYRMFMEQECWKNNTKKEIITTYSQKLSEIIEVTNHVSHNLFADALLKTIGLQYEPYGKVISSFGRGVQVLKSFWEEKGLDTDALQISDGSGLAPANKTTARFLTDLLAYMATQSRHTQVFRNSLPIAGQEGSVRYFLRDCNFDGNFWLKSGSMSGVRCYAGYAHIKEKWYTIVLLCNNFDGSAWLINHYYENILRDAGLLVH